MDPSPQTGCSLALLKERHSDLWRAAQDHPFVHALADGSLDRGRFIHYLKQDYAYLQAYARAVSIVAAKAPTLALMAEFTALAHETLNVEMQLHRDYCTEFAISADQLAEVEASPLCQAYGDFCISAAATGSCVELLAALIPCGVGYAEIGLRLRDRAGAATADYRKWIETYASAEFQQYAGWMCSAFDTLARDVSSDMASQLNRLFILGCRYEWLFWEMAWTLDSWAEFTARKGDD